ncbi:uncharacterized protein LOC131874609 [Cryptomeria japonica]|uniref:uncharacterized protein LOC131874609 n=1 Tax=Cryptomeria japonica TaxID=3369 RepID=UPI0027DA734D|nr:uncharacterized protein LOC131874609 [Cryptomeria japonica]
MKSSKFCVTYFKLKLTLLSTFCQIKEEKPPDSVPPAVYYSIGDAGTTCPLVPREVFLTRSYEPVRPQTGDLISTLHLFKPSSSTVQQSSAKAQGLRAQWPSRDLNLGGRFNNEVF